MKEIIMYEVECIGGCRKTDIVKGKYDRFVCNDCKKNAIEPNVKDFEDAFSLMNAIYKYENMSGKKVSYDGNEAVKKVAKSKTKIPKKYIDKCWSYAYQESHSSGMNDILCTFHNLEDIFN